MTADIPKQASAVSIEKENVKISKVNSPRIAFSLSAFFPIINTILALIVELFVSENEGAMYGGLNDYKNLLYILFAAFSVLSIVSLFFPKFRKDFSRKGWLIGGVVLFLNILNILTVKTLILPEVFFPSLSRVIHVFVADWNVILKNLWSSFVILIEGMIVGTVVGLLTGILVGWSKTASYWLSPFIRFLGPIPSSTWIPLALVVFPSSRGAAIFLIAFAVWFQVSILTSSGIQSVSNSYFEVSSTLGANNFYNLIHVAIPASLNIIFLGVFNATCGAFVALMAAEMLGCDSGIGWYINWQKKMLSYANVYAGIIVIASFCFLFLSLEMKSRDKLLSWQKGVIKW